MAKRATATMSDTLRRTIRDSGLTIYRIAKDTGVSQASLLRFMRGERSLRLDIADGLAEFFGLRLTKGGK